MAKVRQSPIATALVAFLGLASTALAHGDDDETEAPAGSPSVADCALPEGDSMTYQSVPGWCQVPGGRETLGPTHGAIVVDKEGRIYCSMDSGEYGILVYQPDGSLLRSIAKGLAGIHGMCIREEDGVEWIYAARLTGGQVLKLGLDGSVVWSMTGPPKEPGDDGDAGQYKPTAVAVAPNGDFYVADGYGTNWIYQFDKDRRYIRRFGGRGEGPDQFHTCHGLAVDLRGPKPLLLVCDREHRRLVHFDLEGKLVGVVAENLRRPCSVAFRGRYLAIAELEARVTILDPSNKPVAHLGDNPDHKQWANYKVPADAWQDGVFTAPHAVAFDREGNLLVMDWNAWGRISRLNLVRNGGTK